MQKGSKEVGKKAGKKSSKESSKDVCDKNTKEFGM